MASSSQVCIFRSMIIAWRLLFYGYLGTAAGGLILPLVLPYLLRTYGPLKSLRILSIGFVTLLAPVIPFVKPRLPETRVRGPGSSVHAANLRRRKWMTNKAFWFVMAANTLQGFAYFIPILWLPSKRLSASWVRATCFEGLTISLQLSLQTWTWARKTLRLHSLYLMAC
jgi:hypothetical protein